MDSEQEDRRVLIRQRRITLDDGRYMIFYTFVDPGGENASGEAEDKEAAKKDV